MSYARLLSFCYGEIPEDTAENLAIRMDFLSFQKKRQETGRSSTAKSAFLKQVSYRYEKRDIEDALSSIIGESSEDLSKSLILLVELREICEDLHVDYRRTAEKAFTKLSRSKAIDSYVVFQIFALASEIPLPRIISAMRRFSLPRERSINSQQDVRGELTTEIITRSLKIISDSGIDEKTLNRKKLLPQFSSREYYDMIIDGLLVSDEDILIYLIGVVVPKKKTSFRV